MFAGIAMQWWRRKTAAEGGLALQDYAASNAIQRGLATGAQSEIIFGHNELGVQLFHRRLDVQGA